MTYIPDFEIEIQKKLKQINKNKIEELFEFIDKKFAIDLSEEPDALTEKQIKERISKYLKQDKHIERNKIFSGAGFYNHYIPEPVKYLVNLPSFFSAYTPYQAEISQGLLQILYEFQSYVCLLTGLDAANSSLYDGATAAVEAMFMLKEKNKTNIFVVADNINPGYKKVIKTYFFQDEINFLKFNKQTGLIDKNDFEEYLKKENVIFILPQVNYFGYIEEYDYLIKEIKKRGHKVCMIFNTAASAILEPVGKFSADAAVSEAGYLTPLSNFSGPLLGLLACRQEYLRKMPGRLVGKTKTYDGSDAFTLTLQTREQHIRREKATSNICTNQALLASAFTFYLSFLGEIGFKNIALHSKRNADYLFESLKKENFKFKFDNKLFFNEFCIQTKNNPAKIIERCMENNILAGVDISDTAELNNALLVAATELNTISDIDEFVKILKEADK